MVKLIWEVLEEVVSLVVRMRTEISMIRAATFSSIKEAGALVEVVMMIVSFLDNLICSERPVVFLQFTRSCVRNKCRQGRQVVRLLILSPSNRR